MEKNNIHAQAPVIVSQTGGIPESHIPPQYTVGVFIITPVISKVCFCKYKIEFYPIE